MNEITLVINLFTLAIFFSLLLHQHQLQYFVLNNNTIPFSINFYHKIMVWSKKIVRNSKMTVTIMSQLFSNTT